MRELLLLDLSFNWFNVPICNRQHILRRPYRQAKHKHVNKHKVPASGSASRAKCNIICNRWVCHSLFSRHSVAMRVMLHGLAARRRLQLQECKYAIRCIYVYEVRSAYAGEPSSACTMNLCISQLQHRNKLPSIYSTGIRHISSMWKQRRVNTLVKPL